MKYWIVIVACVMLPYVFAQDSVLVFDRPGVADSPYLTMPKKWYFEAGYGLTSTSKWPDLLVPSCMLRRAICSKAELRIAVNTTPQSQDFITKTRAYDGNFTSVGIKQKLIKEKKFIPETAILVNTYSGLCFTKKSKIINAFGYETGFLFQNNLSKFFSINYNFGFISFLGQKSSYLNESTCLNFNLTDEIGAFVENFNYWNVNTNFFEASYDFGLIYALKNKYQIDVSYIANHSKKRTHYGTLLLGFSLKI
ncbi:MAG: hypothetical protein FGM14_03720 [Flavobacteriales bacterium]|nr:hypothetical protein [Flavobacteriales bacterium]